ncbi:peptidyl-prolyl cis-trans isomerase [Bifidobacterium dolichotidis]|uniref:Peptidyl-prolyl cis-trans isomerase n=2 Tax=Bifidobacterium dolichotidis TaxID=2306976 RepID=A0A430FPY0_9BIFI|nr:peptidyl-prolyl cis-trans isomerase [Bifidobacterium dolichotidis]
MPKDPQTDQPTTPMAAANPVMHETSTSAQSEKLSQEKIESGTPLQEVPQQNTAMQQTPVQPQHPYGQSGQMQQQFSQPTQRNPYVQNMQPSAVAYAQMHSVPAMMPTMAPHVSEKPKKPWNTLCIVGFVLAFFIPEAGLVLSIVALNQINKSGERSRALAIAGIVIGAVVTALQFIFALIVLAAIGSLGALLPASLDPSTSQFDMTTSQLAMMM